jgi:hypothetical protein
MFALLPMWNAILNSCRSAMGLRIKKAPALSTNPCTEDGAAASGRNARCRHDGGLQGAARDVHQPGRLDHQANRIDVRYVDGPFKSLNNVWRFDACETGGSIVDFTIAYSFRSRTFQAIAGAVFDRAFQRFAEAFEERANQVYGRDRVA